MRIRCKISRVSGTVVTLGGREYHFLPELDNIAEVEEERDIAILLSIPEGYCAVDRVEDVSEAPDPSQGQSWSEETQAETAHPAPDSTSAKRSRKSKVGVSDAGV